jgi:LTXXQ motif family protein
MPLRTYVRFCWAVLLAVVLAASAAQARRHRHHHSRHNGYHWYLHFKKDFKGRPSGSAREPAATPGTDLAQQSRGTDIGPRELLRTCEELSAQLSGLPVDQIEKTVEPNAEQHAALYELGRASGAASADLHAVCGAEPAGTLPDRLSAIKRDLEAMIRAIDQVMPEVKAFYGSLDNEQQARLVIWMNPTSTQKPREKRTENSPERSSSFCEMPSAIQLIGWPAEQLEDIVRPTSSQLSAVHAVQTASGKAIESIKANCRPEKALTPARRLKTMRRRLDALLGAVNLIFPSVQALYEILTHEQQARLNDISLIFSPGFGA